MVVASCALIAEVWSYGNQQFVLSEYVLLSNNTQCSEKGMLTIDDRLSCKTAAAAIGVAKYLNGVQYLNGQHSDRYPKGCYRDMDGDVFINDHSIGSKHTEYTPICRTRG